MPDDAVDDPFSSCQSFPELLDEFAVLHMAGLGLKAKLQFGQFTAMDGDTNVHGQPVLRRERLRFMASSELT